VCICDWGEEPAAGVESVTSIPDWFQRRASPGSRPTRAMLGRELMQLAQERCSLKPAQTKLALQYLLNWQGTCALDLQPLGIPDKLYVKFGELLFVASSLLTADLVGIAHSLRERATARQTSEEGLAMNAKSKEASSDGLDIGAEVEAAGRDREEEPGDDIWGGHGVKARSQASLGPDGGFDDGLWTRRWDDINAMLLEGKFSDEILKDIWNRHGVDRDEDEDEVGHARKEEAEDAGVSEEEHLRYKRMAQAMGLLLREGGSGHDIYYVPALTSNHLSNEIDARSIANHQALLVTRTEFDFFPRGAFERLLVFLARGLKAKFDYVPLQRVGHEGEKDEVLDGDTIKELATIHTARFKVTLATIEHLFGRKRRVELRAAFSHRRLTGFFIEGQCSSLR